MTTINAFQLISRDREWIARVKAGDAAAFEQLFRTYHGQLCDFAYRYVRSRDLAQELVNDTFAKLWEDRDRLQIRESLKSYLYTALRNRAISHLRHELVEHRGRQQIQLGFGERERSAPDPARQLEAKELTDAIRGIVAGLPDRCRLAITLRWQRQLSYAEVAEVMGISVKTVEIYITRALAALRQSHEALRAYW